MRVQPMARYSEQLADLLPAAADAGQMRRRFEAMLLLEVAHRFGGVAERGAAGAEGARHVLRRVALQPGCSAVQLRALIIGLGRIELETEMRHRGGSGGSSGDNIASSR